MELANIFVIKGNHLKILNKIILILFLFALPITLMWMLFGLAGSTSHYFAIISFGYILTIITAILSLFWKPVQ